DGDRIVTPKRLEEQRSKGRTDGFRLIANADEAAALEERTRAGAAWRVQNTTRRETTRNPKPPFITSTLQGAASSALGFSASKTMRIAQQLYEGMPIGNETVGLITYMRTDSVN